MADEPIKEFLVRNAFIDEAAYQAYRKFRAAHEQYPWRRKPFATAGYIIRLNWAQYRRKNLDDVRVPRGYEDAWESENTQDADKARAPRRGFSVAVLTGDVDGPTDVTDAVFQWPEPTPADYWHSSYERPTIDELFEFTSRYDVVSLDIFDTSIYRKVKFADDIFRVMAAEMGFEDFRRVRKAAEAFARTSKNLQTGSREIVLDDIYDVLETRYGIAREWQQREIELELAASVPNPYIKALYDRLMRAGKQVIFVTDMYLPRSVLEQLLAQAGYKGYSKLFISNEEKVNKGNGDLQALVKAQFAGQTIVHIGDNRASDYEKTLASGIDAIYNPDQRRTGRACDNPDGDLSGSIYHALINNKMNNGLHESQMYFDHGYRVGGILAFGYCNFIEDKIARSNCDLVLFCARDCYILNEVYNEHFASIDSAYVAISRFAIMGATADRYFYDYIGRSVLKHAKRCASSKTIGTVLEESGFGYLVDKLDAFDIDPFLFPQYIKWANLEAFLFDNKQAILEHNASEVDAAREYLGGIIGDHKRILIADIGWSGTCISALKYFLQTQFPEKQLDISGVLMASSRNDVVTGLVSGGTFESYLYGPFENMDLTRFFMPGGRHSEAELDLIHMPLEYLFTSTEPSLVRYTWDDSGKVALERTEYTPATVDIIEQMQSGIRAFCKDYRSYLRGLNIAHIRVNPYLASGPLREAIGNGAYSKAVYGDFLYDAVSAVKMDVAGLRRFAELFSDGAPVVSEQAESLDADVSCRGDILFISPELTYTGTPQSMLRICMVAREADYRVTVWSAKPGPFATEFTQRGIDVEVVPEGELSKPRYRDQLTGFDVVVCNTIVTDAYVRACEGKVPVIWYIREATNIPDFCTGNGARYRTLKTANGITCVSDYAARAISKYTDRPIKVVHNAVEDTSQWALPGQYAQTGVVRFIQLGTIEYRKGYDLLVAAYKSLPTEYKKRSEVVFAGGFIGSGASLASYVFNEISDEPGIRYLGIIKGAQNKTEALSQADVVVVASRDESCSLVALEGAMLSKPLIVTENVGAKYVVSPGNGIVCESGSVVSLRDAMMRMIDSANEFATMGSKSRQMYEQYASMDAHRRDIVELIEETRAEGARPFAPLVKDDGEACAKADTVIVSLTSHPARINTLRECIDTLLNQSMRADKVVLWLSRNQFPGQENDLPESMTSIDDPSFEIRWVEGDLKPHKKYFYAMQEFADSVIITVDDDVRYEKCLVERLYESYLLHPHAVSCSRANLMLFRDDGSLRLYDNWIYDYKAMRDKPTYQLLPTGIGGVLYPPHCLGSDAFNKEVIESICLFGDDLWLKLHATVKGYPAVLIQQPCATRTIDDTQDVGLWRVNTGAGRNDETIAAILAHLEGEGVSKEAVLKRLHGIGQDGEWIGPDVTPITEL